MSGWNYRVVKDKDGFSIREVFYNKEGKIITWTVEACWPYGETLEELKLDVKHLQQALKRGILTEKRNKLVPYEHPLTNGVL